GFVTTALWGATRSGLRGDCFPASRAAVSDSLAATLRPDDKRTSIVIDTHIPAAHKSGNTMLRHIASSILQPVTALLAASRNSFTGGTMTNTGYRPEVLCCFRLPATSISSLLIPAIAALHSAVRINPDLHTGSAS